MSIDWAGLVVIVRLLLMLTWYWQYLMRLYESETWHLEPWKFKLMVTLTLLLFGDLSDPQLGLLWISYHSSLSFLFFGKPRIDLKQVWWQKKKCCRAPWTTFRLFIRNNRWSSALAGKSNAVTCLTYITLQHSFLALPHTFCILFKAHLWRFLMRKKKNKTKNATGM